MDPALNRSPARLPNSDFWSGRRVLVTGHTGFKGSWLTLWLSMLGARIQGLSLPTNGAREAHWQALDVPIEDEILTDVVETEWQSRVRAFAPEVIIHLAAQSLVSVGYDAPYETFSTNVMGTGRILEFVAGSDDVSAMLVATTDKVYDPRQSLPHAEDAYLGGSDPYSASKAATELMMRAWPPGRAAVVAARAGNVIGGGDWSPRRLVPDMVRAWAAGHDVSIREPDAVRPWQHVLEPLAGYLLYLETTCDASVDLPRALNFGPADRQRVPVQEVVTVAAQAWADATGLDVRPGYSAAPESERMDEVSELLIDSRRAEELLGWASSMAWEDAVRMTVDWYTRADAGIPAADLSRLQINQYVDWVRR